MKARTLVLILCIGLMCFTGFGSTTADLTDNSTPEMVQSDLAVSVIVVPQVTLEVTKVSVDTAENRFDSLFQEAEQAFALEYAVELERLSVPPDLISLYNTLKSETRSRIPDISEGDVGWHDLKTNFPDTPFHTDGLTRNPRAGLRYA